MPLPDIIASLSDNPYFGAGAGLFGLGMVATVAKRSTVLFSMVFRNRCMVSLEVANTDRSFEWLLQWISAKRAQTRHLSAVTAFRETDSGFVQSSVKLLPSPGDHFIFHGGRLIKVERNRHQQSMQVSHIRVPYETVTLSTIGFSPSFLERIIEDAQSLALSQMESSTVIFQAVGHEWRPFGHPRRKRPLESVVLDEGMSDRIVDDVQEFIRSSDWYISRGIPYRRGYLLHGPPGCGKSSFIAALAGHINYSICVLSLSEPTLTDDRLNHLLNMAPLRSLILLEDVDAAFVSRDYEQNSPRQIAYQGLPHVTLSGLLNAIDGVSSSDARILFMTTNHPDRLDAAMTRPGRVDVKHFIGACTDAQLQRMLRAFYAQHQLANAQTDLFVTNCRRGADGRPLTPALVQGYLLAYKDDHEAAIRNADMLIDSQTNARRPEKQG